MRCQYCKNGLSYLDHVKKPRPPQNVRLRCVYCGVVFTERKRYQQKNPPWFVPLFITYQSCFRQHGKIISNVNVWYL